MLRLKMLMDHEGKVHSANTLEQCDALLSAVRLLRAKYSAFGPDFVPKAIREYTDELLDRRAMILSYANRDLDNRSSLSGH